MNNNSLQPFEFNGSEVRTVLIDDEPWFVASDIAKILGYGSAKDMTRRLDDEDKGRRSVPTLGGHQMMTVINEPGLYVAVLGSHVEGARKFKRWVTAEVLPAIRKSGSYSVAPQVPQSYAEALRELASNVEARELAEARAKELEAPARSWTVLADAHGDYSVDEAAKMLSRDERITTGRQRLFGFMESLGWIYRHGSRNRWHAYQAQVDCGRLVQKMSAAFMNTRTGEMENPAPTIRVTAKGLEELHKRILEVQEANHAA